MCSFLWLSSIPLEKAMATHSSVLAWRIPGTGKPGGLPSMGSHRVRHDWSDLAAAAAAAVFHCVYIPQLIHAFVCWWTSRLLACFQVKSVAKNTGIHVSFSILVSSGYTPRSGTAGSYGGFIPFFFFKEISIPSSIKTMSTYIPTSNARGFPILHTLSSIYYL